jgi:hypothetical protein
VKHPAIREYAVVAEQVQLVDNPQAPVTHGPMQEYDARVRAGLLRDDEHQRGELLHLVMCISVIIACRMQTGPLRRYSSANILSLVVFQPSFNTCRISTSS